MGFQWEFLKDESMRDGKHVKQNTFHKYSNLFYKFIYLFIYLLSSAVLGLLAARTFL